MLITKARPAIITTYSERSPVSGDLAFWAARQHRRQIPFQLDLKFALVRRRDDGVDEASKRLRGVRAQ